MHSTTKSIAENTAAQMIGKIISTLLGLLAIGMMTRYLGAEQFGWYVTTISFLGFVGILVDFGLVPVTAQMMSQSPPREWRGYARHAENPETEYYAQLLRNLLAYRFVTAVFFLGLAPLAALLFPYPHEVKIAIGFTTISFLGVAMNQVFLGLYQQKLKTHIAAIGEVVGRIVLVAGLFFIIKTNQGFIPVMWIVVASAVAYTAVMWRMAAKEQSVSFAFDSEIWKAITKKMWPIAIAIMFNVIYLKGDLVLLSLFRDQVEVGVYGAAYRVIDILAQTAMMVMGVMLPLLAYQWSRNIKETFRHYYQQSFDLMMAFALPMLVALVILATPIMTLVAGDEFTASGIPLQILAIAIFGVYLGAIFGHAAVAINKQKAVLPIYIVTAILTLIGYLIYIPKFGMLGAAWMSVFSELFAGISLLLFVRYHTKERLNLTVFAKIAFASMVMGATIYLMADTHVLIRMLVGGIVYALFVFGTGVISRETMREIIGGKAER